MRAAPLSGYAVFAAMLTAAGLPIYIHAPKFYVDQYGVSLAALGSVLFGLRLLDVVQDPALGWLSERLHRWRSLAVLAAVALLVASMAALFAVVPPVAPLLWFALSLTGLFTAFSFLTITFYAQGVSRAGRMGPGGHVRLAAWRETGGLLGVSVAAVAPTVLMTVTAAPFAAFALGFGGLAAVAALAMWRDWSLPAAPETTGWREVLADAVARRLLLLALINATPVAVTSTLFLFFVESRLGLPGWEGPLLVLFFLSAAASAPGWGRAARRFGEKPALLAGMGLSILAFGFATLLGTGDGLAFAAICVASGAALGADMTLLPAIFAGRMARIAPNAGQAFGLWSFVSKFTLALAAVAVLPLLQAAGFEPGETASPERALVLLSLLYAALPCALKLVALALLAATPLNRETIG
ncbi:MFS transporter [Rhodovulum sulfidophilum]|uniref:MFS transporter n=1 Tax=Rhodovulum sulfidophilum TaxID=35806 RepID=UPI000951BF97|nr:MFS transporter [Rhodovulum sulfidophilum]MBL3552111.1 MFS transporter [Rhodovulum sulfidophilum]OLS47264.1 sugar:cation symporter [Rhodovulum sulfidophilum]